MAIHLVPKANSSLHGKRTRVPGLGLPNTDLGSRLFYTVMTTGFDKTKRNRLAGLRLP